MSRPEDVNASVERATARNFIQWYNQESSRNFTLLKKQETPDFIYSDKNGKLELEVTTAHYNQDHARITAGIGREIYKLHTIQEINNNPEGVDRLSINEPEKILANFINTLLVRKCKKPYSENCILIIRIPDASMTTKYEFLHEVIPSIKLPKQNPFKEIYLTEDQQDYFKLT